MLKFDQVVKEDGELPQIQLQTFQRLLQSRTLANRVIDLTLYSAPASLGAEIHLDLDFPLVAAIMTSTQTGSAKQ